MPFRYRSRLLLGLLSLSVTILVPVSSLAEPPKTLAILGFQGSDVTEDVLSMLSNAARAGAFRSTERGRLLVLSRESIAEVVEAAELKHCDGECAVDIGQDLGADYVMFGEVSVVDGGLVSTIHCYETEWESRLGSETVRAEDHVSLMDKIEERVAAMLSNAPGVTDGGSPGASRHLNESSKHLDGRAVRIKEKDNGDWFFQTKEDGAITENEFVRRFASITGRTDADRFEQNRSTNRVVIGVALTVIGAGSMAFGFSQPEYDSCLTCPLGVTPNPAHIWPIAGGASLAGIGLLTTVVNLLNPDGIATDHSMSMNDAERLIDLHNEALGTDANGPSPTPEVSPLSGSHLGQPRAQKTARLWSIVAGPAGIGVAGTF